MIRIARAVQAELDGDLETIIWNQHLSEPGDLRWRELVSKARSGLFDLALLVLGAEVKVTSRRATSRAPRDNVLLELGLFCGALGPDRTFFLVDRDNEPKIASNLAGVAALSYGGHRHDGNLRSAVGPACEEIRMRVEMLMSSRYSRDRLRLR